MHFTRMLMTVCNSFIRLVIEFLFLSISSANSSEGYHAERSGDAI